MTGETSTLRPHDGYRRLRSFQVTEIIYDGTVAFCDRFVDKRSRTRDQMIQAARSGRQADGAAHRAQRIARRVAILGLLGLSRVQDDAACVSYFAGFVSDTNGFAVRSWPTWHWTQTGSRVGWGTIGAPATPVSWHVRQSPLRGSTSCGISGGAPG
jgi:hypothetical protein